MKLHLPTLIAVAALTLSACGAGSPDAVGPSTYPSATVQTSFPGYVAATGDAQLTGLADATPAPGTVTWVEGPFDDRFRTSQVRLENGAVHGALTITTDVSSILDLQVQAGFFAADGSYLGSASWSLLAEHEEEHEGVPDESVSFVVEAPAAYAGKAVAASAGVVSLVNE